MTRGYIFDYGGTLDTGGRHWGKVLWRAYSRHGIPVTEKQFREAYVHAERTLGSQPIVKPDFTFRRTLDAKLRIELEHLATTGALDGDKTKLTEMRQKMLDDIYESVKLETSKSRKVLESMAAEHPLVLVSNFYGNIRTVLDEFGLDGLFKDVIESAVAGIRKPDPRIFTLGVEALGLKTGETTVVGDSITKDIIPAKQAGCRAVWLKGEGWDDTPQDETLPDAVITELGQLLDKERIA